MTEIVFEGVEKRFARQRVIEPLDLTIADREFFTLVGPSGCGKSTVLNMIAGLEEVSAGTIYFDARPMTGVAPGDRDVAMVFQSYALYPHMSVFDNIAFPLRVKKLPRRQVAAEVNRVAEALGLAALLARRPRELSGGQRQRVALGRALVRRPRAFLMDEPLSNLDARLRIDMREELKRLHGSERTTTVYVTHDQEEAMVLSDRVAVFDAGRIRQVGTPQALYQDPDNLFVAQFIGNPPINVLSTPLARECAALLGLDAGTAEFVLGVRPADIGVHAAPAEGPALAAPVVLLEPTGSDLWVVGERHGQRLKGRAAPGTALTPGAKAHFLLPARSVLAFDARSGARRR